MILAAHLSRGLRLAPIAALVLAGATCAAPPPPRPPECPSGRWCGTLDQAEALGQTREHVLTCPMYVASGEGGAATPVHDGGDPQTPATGVGDGGLPLSKPPGTDLPPGAEGKLDLEATRARRLTGAADSCCYAWLTHCPEGKPLPSGSTAPGRR
jgi:hypothetical protein